MGLKSNDWFLHKRKERELQIHRNTQEGRRPCEKDWSDVAMSQGMPRNASKQQKLVRGKEGATSRAFRGSTALPKP